MDSQEAENTFSAAYYGRGVGTGAGAGCFWAGCSVTPSNLIVDSDPKYL